MALGMSREEYWTGDPLAAWDYIKADELKRERANEMAWLQGKYVYDAIGSFREFFMAFGKKGKIKADPYTKEPYSLSQNKAQERKEKEIQDRKDRIKRKLKASVKGGTNGSHS